jgi:hypothetical protein
MDQSNTETTKPLPRAALVLVATTAGTVTLAWFAFLVWLAPKAWSLLYDLPIDFALIGVVVGIVALVSQRFFGGRD